MPSYNDLRRAYGLAPARSFTDITGEATERFPTVAAISDRTRSTTRTSSTSSALTDDEGRTLEAGSRCGRDDAVVGDPAHAPWRRG